ncbi:hypothetical protein ABZY09_35020 [Streptomyces sp. NPDC002928]|uniref:hypothetical protein n=1 Tax=Streptomyces sp. NPDC002928 TaxID=3154440 RepID=UPI0033A86DB8
MRTLVTLVHEGGAPQDFVVTADDTATAGDVAEVLGTAVGRAAPPPGGTPGNVVPMRGTPAPPPGYGTAVTGALSPGHMTITLDGPDGPTTTPPFLVDISEQGRPAVYARLVGPYEIIGLEAPDGERSALLHEALLDELLPTWRDDVAAVG